MNCKQGDLAIVVRSKTGLNLGKIVRCVRFAGRLPADPTTGNKWEDGEENDHWEIDPPLVSRGSSSGKFTPLLVYPDFRLRPLRGDLLDNETETGRELVHAR